MLDGKQVAMTLGAYMSQILDQGNTAFSSRQFAAAIPFFSFVQNVTRMCSPGTRLAEVFASQFGPDSNGFTELATVNGSTAYYVDPDVLSDDYADIGASDPLGATLGEAALHIYNSPYSNLPGCVVLNAQVHASSSRHSVMKTPFQCHGLRFFPSMPACMSTSQ